MGMERRNYKSEPQGTQSYLSRQEELRVWLKSTEPQGRTSKYMADFDLPLTRLLAALEGQHFSPPEPFILHSLV